MHGRAACVLFELPVEVGKIIEAALHSDLHNLLVAALQQFASVFDADLCDVRNDTGAGDTLKAIHEIAGTERNELCK